MNVDDLREGRTYVDVHLSLVVLREIRMGMAVFKDGTGLICTVSVTEFASLVTEEWRMGDEHRLEQARNPA